MTPDWPDLAAEAQRLMSAGLPLTEAERKLVRMATARGPELRQAWSDLRERREARRKRERRAKKKVQRRAKAVLMRKRRAAGDRR